MNRIFLSDVMAGHSPALEREAFLASLLDFMNRYSLALFALLFLLVASSGIQVLSVIWARHLASPVASAAEFRVPAPPRHGPNLVVASGDLAQTIQRITTQHLTLTVKNTTVPVTPETIKSWLQVVTDNSHHIAYIHLNEGALTPDITKAVAPYIKAPVNQVTATYADGSSKVIAVGHDGTNLADTAAATKQLSQSLLGAQGLNLNLPLSTAPFQAVTPAAFGKLIEVNVVTKQMYLYDNGTMTRTYPISAGAVATPTPIGQYKIYSKFAVQDMRGYNANGTKYFQPHVRWISYFLPGGYAVHGNYWRPLSWFGAINSSHGCVSLPDSEAQWVYDWAPIGTTVITHY